jgi:cellulose synthase/poly-beta-1,6-N-acetylglucosamine synthase-like glycosyltransferase
MRLSILICTLPERRAFLSRLSRVLDGQCIGQSVEILLDDRAKGIASIGAKRNALLRAAKGDYVAFCDDDDLVSKDYLQRVLHALKDNPDCAELRGIITTNGKNPKPFHHTITCTHWHEKDGVYLRMPNHLNAVRRELALQVGFPDNSFGEDADYSRRLHPLLKTQGSVPTVIYHYLFRSKK